MVTDSASGGIVIGRVQLVAVGRHHVSLIVEMKHSGPGVGGLAVGHLHLKEASSLDCQIQRIAGGVEIALRLDHLRRRRTRAQTDLQSRGDGGVLRGRSARHHQVLVDHVFELKTATAKPGGARVR